MSAVIILLIPQNAGPDVWSWTEFLRAIAGPIIAAVFVVLGIILKEAYDRSKSAQSWYEEYYLTNGIDRLISYLMTVEMLINNIHNDPDPAALKSEFVPYEAMTRLQVLLRRRDFVPLSMLFTWIPRFRKNPKYLEIVRIAANGLQHNLDELRKELIKARVRRKSDVYKIADDRRIAEELAKIKQTVDTAQAFVAPHVLAGPIIQNDEKIESESRGES